METGTQLYAQSTLMNAINEMRILPPSRDVALAITNAEQALMWLRRIHDPAFQTSKTGEPEES